MPTVVKRLGSSLESIAIFVAHHAEEPSVILLCLGYLLGLEQRTHTEVICHVVGFAALLCLGYISPPSSGRRALLALAWISIVAQIIKFFIK